MEHEEDGYMWFVVVVHKLVCEVEGANERFCFFCFFEIPKHLE